MPAAQHHEGEEADRASDAKRSASGAAPPDAVVEPPKRKSGVKVKSVAELVDKLRNEAKVI
jgi:electron transfer flavoprotein beta subunit